MALGENLGSANERLTKRRRSSGGHVRQRPGGKWAYWMEAPPGPDGRRRQVSKGGFATKRDAQRALTEAQATVAAGNYVARSKMNLGHYLEEEWLPAIRATVRPTTHEHYASNVRAHIAPRLGHVILQDLSSAQLNRLYADLLENGRRQGTGGLSPKSVRHIHTLIRRALHDATSSTGRSTETPGCLRVTKFGCGRAATGGGRPVARCSRR